MASFMEQLRKQQQKKKTRVCVGLDPDIDKLPLCCKTRNGPVMQFCKSIVAATAEFTCTYKPNLAFFSALGMEDTLSHLIEFIQGTFGMPVILDAKYGDIGNTAERYAYTAFRRFGADAVTLSPYLGFDSIDPFVRYDNNQRGALVLCRTSNNSAPEFQGAGVPPPTGSKPLYLQVAEKIKTWNDGYGNVGAVFGATFPDELAAGRRILGPDVLALLPGIGKQGGPLEETITANRGGFCVVNSSRGIIHASQGDDFAEVAAQEAEKLRDAINAAWPIEVVTTNPGTARALRANATIMSH